MVVVDMTTDLLLLHNPPSWASGLPIAERTELPQGGRNLVATSVLDEPLRRDIVVRRKHNVTPSKVELQSCKAPDRQTTSSY
jgi:hypothetical protein